MMSCASLRPLLSLYLEKETGPRETLEARRHLDSCASCQGRARRIARVMDRVDALPARSASADVAAMVMERLSQLKESALRKGPALAMKWSGLAVIAAAGLAALMQPGSVLSTLFRRPAALLARFTGGQPPDSLGDAVGAAVPFARAALSGGWGTEVASGAGLHASVAIQLLATTLALGLTLAIPIALLTAWLLHREAVAGTSGK